MELANRRSVTRGESDFAHLPGVAAWVYDWLLRIGPTRTQTREIAAELSARLASGRLLDIGSGPGTLLAEVHRTNAALHLFGLDISPAMIRRAGRNLRGIGVDLRQGRVQATNYASDFFDMVTSVGSFYLWDQPAEGVDEIFRILKAGWLELEQNQLVAGID